MKTLVVLTVFTVWLPTIATFSSAALWLFILTGLMYNFLRSWLGDPGYISPPPMDRLKTVVELAEKNDFNVSKLCTTCLVVRPIRSKHCSVCGKCVQVMDHHCPFVGNCVGKKNHRFFLGYLLFLTFAGIWTIWAGFTYLGQLGKDCRLSSEAFLLTIGPAMQCSPWSMFILIISMGFTVWIGCLAVMQTYQISMMAMTTNERINRKRYGHFHDEEGEEVNPFDKGFVKNCMEFLECDPTTIWGGMRRRTAGGSYEQLKTPTV